LRFFIIFIILFLGCSQETKKAPKEVKLKQEIIIIKNNKLIYPKKRVILIFCDNSDYSFAQKEVLKKLNLKFYEINSTKLKSFFNIKYYPTIVILENNKTIKYEKFVPYEMLKEEKF
jgi:hypothetical protein